MNITITHVIPCRILGVYNNAGTWTQAYGTSLATALAVLDEVPATTGVKSATLYEDEYTLLAVDTYSDVEVEFFAFLDGVVSGDLTSVSDATVEIIINLIGNTLIKNNHGRAIAKRLPSGMAWLGDSIKGFIKGLSTELRRSELDINNRAKIDNMLFGDNLDNWLEAVGLDPQENKEDILTQKLTDKSGITPADITAALHLAGFTDLYCYANKFQITNDPAEFGIMQFGDFEFTPFYRFYSVDPRKFEENIPVVCFGPDMRFGDFEFTRSFYSAQLEFGDFEFGPAAEFGGAQKGGDLLVDDLIDDSDKWVDIPDDRKKWYRCFFIAGSEKFGVADLPENQKKDLRKLLLERKPLKMYAILFINYVRT